MTTIDGKLNAKQRRKLLREQQRLLKDFDYANNDSSSTQKQDQERVDCVKQDPNIPVEHERNDDGLADAANMIDKIDTDTGSCADVGSNAQQLQVHKHKAKRKANGVDSSKTAKKQRNGREATAKSIDNHKSIHLTLFVGQLPFKATEEMIRKHFAESGEIQVRMLTDKKTKKFKGMAFIEVKDSKALGAALSRHHTLLLGRRINVEMTASGGGTKSENRRNKIDLLRKKQSNVQVEKTKALIQKHIDGQEFKLQQDDVDDRMIDFLSWFDYETAKKALDEYNRCVSDRVKNRKAFFMGILKRFRQTDGVE
ncbi:h aca ribonucleoprotein complex subunit 1 [Plasmopara halstedii]|uniref:H aca ribonucleoprotein complex subunit 1 n=1 Tax=Plasmopara halstedii TaxID=4781 RepID=A0A0P1ADY9_PLAHL|nr:h aca ribonucleoprotein complex subunit 1 [Plasmopara halstedii]CEG38972.1 h aca ribonucleoprotein complex subunit 1 [Plasmopara halstedii]|eukprot:XP_024575341.1 h aca ribonucleoprotein complex subunit 1 [Plasmopara halstedii]